MKKQKKQKPLSPTLKRIGIFMLDDRMGDFILSMPTLEHLSTFFSGRADLYVASQHVSLAQQLPSFRQIIPYRHQTKKRKSFSQLLGYLKLFFSLPFKRYQAVIFISGRITESTLSILTLAPRRIALSWARRPKAYTQLIELAPNSSHVMQSLASILECIGKTPPIEPIRLTASAQAVNQLNVILKAHCIDENQKLAVIHPSAGLAHRCWPKERFSEVADALIDQGMKVCMIGAPGEKALIDEIRGFMRNPEESFFFAEPLTVLLALFQRADLLFSNESGPTHLAATTQIPIVTIFGPTDPESWSPMRKENLTMLSKKELCSCKDPRHCDKDWPCIKEITVDEALNALKEYT
ncbi:glycosyltransferase family 9 protein [Pontiellaceae bacterium B1224]|nr:glycosyltransferase family 9 protein [Pontiellaceae bacterium B1224]